MDLKKLTPGEMVTAISGILLLIFSFFHWYSVDLGPFGTFSRNGWQSPDAFWSIVAIIIGIVSTALNLLTGGYKSRFSFRVHRRPPSDRGGDGNGPVIDV